MDIIKKLEWRYATKKFDNNKTLSKKKLNILKEAFNLTATSFGLQTIKLLVLEDKEKRKLLVEYAYEQRQVLDASHLFVICIQNDIVNNDINKYFENIKTIRSTPDAILNPFKKDLLDMMENKSEEERQLWSKNQAYIALGNLMTVCAMEDIDACPMEGFLTEKFDEALDLHKSGLKSVLLLPVGYRAKDDMFSGFKKVRKPIEEVVIEL